MITNKDISTLFEEAKTLYAMGHDNKYIELQLADKGVDDTTIDEIIKEIKSLRKSNKKNHGIRLVIYSASIMAVGFLFTLLSYHSDSPVRFVLWGLVVSGVLTLIKGLGEMMGLI